MVSTRPCWGLFSRQWVLLQAMTIVTGLNWSRQADRHQQEEHSMPDFLTWVLILLKR